MKTFEVESFDGAHPGRTIWIVGCGPSLRNWAQQYFRGHVCIFINTAVHYVDGITTGRDDFYRIIFDQPALLTHHLRTAEFPYYKNVPLKIPAVHSFMPEHVWERLNTDEKNFAKDTVWSLYHSHGFDPFKYPLVGKHLFYPTLFSAMSLGLRMGAATLKLVGVDYGPVDGVTHWDRQADVEKTRIMGQYQRECMEKEMLPVCKEYGIEVERWRCPEIKLYAT